MGEPGGRSVPEARGRSDRVVSGPCPACAWPGTVVHEVDTDEMVTVCGHGVSGRVPGVVYRAAVARLRADFARDKDELRQMLADSENQVEQLRAELANAVFALEASCQRELALEASIARAIAVNEDPNVSHESLGAEMLWALTKPASGAP